MSLITSTDGKLLANDPSTFSDRPIWSESIVYSKEQVDNSIYVVLLTPLFSDPMDGEDRITANYKIVYINGKWLFDLNENGELLF